MWSMRRRLLRLPQLSRVHLWQAWKRQWKRLWSGHWSVLVQEERAGTEMQQMCGGSCLLLLLLLNFVLFKFVDLWLLVILFLRWFLKTWEKSQNLYLGDKLRGVESQIEVFWFLTSSFYQRSSEFLKISVGFLRLKSFTFRVVVDFLITVTLVNIVA